MQGVKLKRTHDLLLEKVIFFSVRVVDVIVIIRPIVRVRPERRGGS